MVWSVSCADGFLHLHLKNQVRAALQVQPELDLVREIIS